MSISDDTDDVSPGQGSKKFGPSLEVATGLVATIASSREASANVGDSP